MVLLLPGSTVTCSTTWRSRSALSLKFATEFYGVLGLRPPARLGYCSKVPIKEMTGAGEVAPWVKCLLFNHGDLSLILQNGCKVHVCNPMRTWKWKWENL